MPWKHREEPRHDDRQEHHCNHQHVKSYSSTENQITVRVSGGEAVGLEQG